MSALFGELELLGWSIAQLGANPFGELENAVTHVRIEQAFIASAFVCIS